MKVILKKNGNFFVWTVLPFLFLIISIASVGIFSKNADSRVGNSCSGIDVTACSTIPAGPDRQDCINAARNEFCNADRSMPCIREKCSNTACVADGTDTSIACTSPNTCGNGRVETSERCDQSATPNGCAPGDFCFNCGQCNHPITVITARVGCDSGTIDAGETCDVAPGPGDPTPRTILAPGVPPLVGACRPHGTNGECTFCGDGQVQTTAGEECDPRDTLIRLPDRTFCDNTCKIKPVPSAPPAASPTCGDGILNGSEICDSNRSPTGCYINPSSGREEGSCVSCQCLPWMLEGGGGSGGTKCSFSPAAFFSLSGILTELGLMSLIPLAIACCRSRKKK